MAGRYDIMNFKQSSFTKVGSWDLDNALELETSQITYLGGGDAAPSGVGNTLTGFHLRIGIVPEPPIAYLDERSCVNDTSLPSCWYGWNPDIIAKLASDLNFTYEYIPSPDGKWGGFNEETGMWNGMVKSLLDHEIDLSIALSINRARSAVIDYTDSFFEDQVSLSIAPPQSYYNMLTLTIHIYNNFNPRLRSSCLRIPPPAQVTSSSS